MPLVFDPVIREDLNTDFKCLVRNTLSFQTLRTTVKEGMYLGNIPGESSMASILWMPDKATSSPDDCLGGPPFSVSGAPKAELSFFYDLFFVGWELALGDYVQGKI